MNPFGHSTQPIPSFPGSQNHVDGIRNLDPTPDHDCVQPCSRSTDPRQEIYISPSSGPAFGSGSSEIPDFPDDCLKFMTEILVEDDLDDVLGSFTDCNAIQATEKSFRDALTAFPHSSDQFPSFAYGTVRNPNGDLNGSFSIHGSGGYSSVENVDLNWAMNPTGFSSSPLSGDTNSSSEYSHPFVSSPNSFFTDSLNRFVASPLGLSLPEELNSKAKFDWFTEACKYMPSSASLHGTKIGEEKTLSLKNVEVEAKAAGKESLESGSRGRKNHPREESNYQDMRSNKYAVAANGDDNNERMEEYDDVLVLWDEKKDDSSLIRWKAGEKILQNGNLKASKGRKKGGKKQANKEEVVDLSTLLTHCAQAVAGLDLKTANKLLEQIRQHSNPHGDSIERLAYYFAYGLEARLVGSSSLLSADPVVDIRVSSSDVLKAHRTYVSVIPLKRASHFVANQTITKLAKKATRIHIIDFGIFLGFQWPCFIQSLSDRENGPPKLRITGIGFPQRGFRPAAIVEEAGRRLSGYCKRFGVPFEYHSIAKRWEAIQPEEIHIDRDELIVANCLYESRTLLDNTVEVDCPRDAFLRLVRKLKPDLFIHGIINGTFSAPFFLTRFKEALFHYSTIFDMLEATIPPEDPERILLERHLYGKAAMNVIACEGVERLERPETYKQWQIRTQRAGFCLMPLDEELMSKVKGKVKLNYHKDFVLGEDNHWMIQGWKGRILYALSCWTPI